MDFWASLEHKLRYKKEINPSDAEELAKDLKECGRNKYASGYPNGRD